jgi:hypothetical protein
MLTLVAPVVLQLKIELSPSVIVDGSAEKELMMGSVGAGPLHPIINIKIITAKDKAKNLK